MCKWTNDAQRFLLEHFDTIHNSPSQMYHSALPFCPSSSWLFKCYSGELLNEVKVVKGLSAEWGACVRAVTVNDQPGPMSYWKNTVAVGLDSGNIIILDAITGSQTSVLSEHINWVTSIAFSSDGVLLVSGSEDRTIKLWDIQTGGVVKTFSGHDGSFYSVCISADSTMIVSGSDDSTIKLWNVQTGECCYTIELQEPVHHVTFLPIDPQHFISISGSRVQQWDTNGHQIGPEYTGYYIAFSLDGTQFALCDELGVTVHNAKTKAIIAKFQCTDRPLHCCFSPDTRLIAASVVDTIYLWDIATPDPHHIVTFVGHSDTIHHLAFSSPSSLISVSRDRLIKFWQIGNSLVDLAKTEPKSITYHLAQALSITLQAADGIILTCDSSGVVMVWDIWTGHCKRSITTPLNYMGQSIQLIKDKLVVIWVSEEQIVIWDSEKQEQLEEVAKHGFAPNWKISRDGSRVYILSEASLEVWSISTGQKIGGVELESPFSSSFLIVEGSRVWAGHSQRLEGWDFEVPDSPIQLCNTPPSILHQSGTILWDILLPRVQDTASGKTLFQPNAALGKPYDAQWGDHHLVLYFHLSKQILILDFSHVLLQ